MAKGKTLVTSAAGGTQGKTGRHVAELLLKRNVPVRALVRQIDERSDRLKALGFVREQQSDLVTQPRPAVASA